MHTFIKYEKSSGKNAKGQGRIYMKNNEKESILI